MNRWRIAVSVAGLVGAGLLGSSLPGLAQKKPAQASNSTIGFVDLASVTEQIKETTNWKQLVRKFEDERSKYRNEIEDLAKIRFLTSAERQELSNLRSKPKATDGEKKRIQELEDHSGKLDREYQSLAMQEKLTSEQSARLKELTDLREKASGDLQDEYEKRAQQLQKSESQMLEEMQKQILEIVGKVAENKNLGVVVDRQAILYGGQDLTQEVLGKLPK